MKHKTSNILYSYWNKVRGDRVTPRRFEIEPAQIAAILPATFILERVDAERVYWRNVSLAFQRIQRDLSLARNRPPRDNTGNPDFKIPAFAGQPTDPRALGDPNVEFTRGGILVPNGSTADLQRIGYRFA